MVRGALYEAAQVMLTRVKGFSTLKRWAVNVAKRRVSSSGWQGRFRRDEGCRDSGTPHQGRIAAALKINGRQPA